MFNNFAITSRQFNAPRNKITVQVVKPISIQKKKEQTKQERIKGVCSAQNKFLAANEPLLLLYTCYGTYTFKQKIFIQLKQYLNIYTYIFCYIHRRRCRTRNAALAYSISGTPSTMRTISKSSGSTKQMLSSSRPTASQLYQENTKFVKLLSIYSLY